MGRTITWVLTSPKKRGGEDTKQVERGTIRGTEQENLVFTQTFINNLTTIEKTEHGPRSKRKGLRKKQAEGVGGGGFSNQITAGGKGYET